MDSVIAKLTRMYEDDTLSEVYNSIAYPEHATKYVNREVIHASYTVNGVADEDYFYIDNVTSSIGHTGKELLEKYLSLSKKKNEYYSLIRELKDSRKYL